MKHIFISHAGADSAIADRLAGDLKNAGHDTRVDTRELTLGSDSIKFMNDGVANAHTIIILYSQHTPSAKWQQLEINAAAWNEVEQGGGTCIVVRLDDTEIPPILGPKVYGKVDCREQGSYRQLLDGLCDAILSGKTASSVFADAFGSETKNPFRRVRAEHFEDRPDLLARAFAAPDATKMDALEDMKPCFLEGSRGTGKSMLLLSVRGRNSLTRTQNRQPGDSVRVFGFYLKLTRGALCNCGFPLTSDDEPDGLSPQEKVQVADISSQEIMVCLVENLLSELEYCARTRLLPLDGIMESQLAQAVNSALFSETETKTRDLQALQDKLADTHRKIAEFVRKRFIYREDVPVPIATFDLDALKRVLDLVRRYVAPLSQTMFVALLDEYENLFEYQKRIVNGLIKLASPHLSVKVAKKHGTGDVSGTTVGQELQETHDYTRIILAYDVEDSDQWRTYLELLGHIVSKLLESEGLPATDVASLLPEAASHEVEEGSLLSHVARLCKVREDDFRCWPEKRQNDGLTRYRRAATYRVLFGVRGPRKPKRFSGYRELAFLSSGVIRYFQEILGVAYHLTYDSSEPAGQSLCFAPETQSRAVHIVSEHNLTTLSRNVESVGEVLKYFLLDLGDCLRLKLLQHMSEPEAARLTLLDPECLQEPRMQPLSRLLLVGEREGVFQTKEGRPAYKPKHHSDPQPSEFNVCRVFAPVLEISPRLRWRTEIRCEQLLGLITPNLRTHALQQLKQSMMGRGSLDDQAEIPGISGGKP